MSGRIDCSDSKYQRLCWALQALAMRADVQVDLFPDFVCKGDELALEFEEHSQALDADRVTDEQRQALKALDQKLASMSNGGPDYSEALWFDERTLSTSSHWAEVRTLAAEVLRVLAWPVERPPDDPENRGSIYVQG